MYRAWFVGIMHQPQVADETARAYLSVAPDRAARWLYLRIYVDESEAGATELLRRLQVSAPMKIVKLLADNGSQFTDRITRKTKEPTGKDAFDCGCMRLRIRHRLIRPRHPQTNGMVERFKGRISDILGSTPHFRSSEGLRSTSERYHTPYNEHLPQRALGHQTRLQAMRARREKRPELFVRKTRSPAALDS